MTAEQREDANDLSAYRQNIDIENWSVCEDIYKRLGRATIHIDHSHGRHKRVSPRMIKRDLQANMCRIVIGESWIYY
jgi:hypothetical protein